MKPYPLAILTMILFFSSLQFPTSSLAQNQVNWSDENWAHGCEFNSQDAMEEVQASSSECGPVCETKAGCTHFNWRPSVAGGICELMSGRVAKSQAALASRNKVVCGVSIDANVIWNNQNWAPRCEFDGEAYNRLQTNSGEDCRTSCDSDPECTHYSWSQLNGGTCKLRKLDEISKLNAFATMDRTTRCGLRSNRPVTSDSINWSDGDWADNCEFKDQPRSVADRQIARGGPSECRQWCVRSLICTHYIWTQSDNLCRLMKGKVTKADAVSVRTSATVCGIVSCSGAGSGALRAQEILNYYAVIVAFYIVLLL